jgi:glyoxylase-like metal-dependent hydrolase (beta-lactamase superfamily II)
MSDFDREYEIALNVIIATNESGDVVVVNTGPEPDDLARLNDLWAAGVSPRCQLSIETPFEEHLKSLGLGFSDVDVVLVTPLQAYTVGNLPLFQNARIGILRSGWEFFFDTRYKPHPHDYPPNVFPPRVLNYLIYEAHERLLLLDDNQEILPGVSVRFTGGHHRASMGVSFATGGGEVVASDSAFVRENLQPGRVLGIIENMYEVLDAYEWFRSVPHFIPLYDPDVAGQYPGGIG